MQNGQNSGQDTTQQSLDELEQQRDKRRVCFGGVRSLPPEQLESNIRAAWESLTHKEMPDEDFEKKKEGIARLQLCAASGKDLVVKVTYEFGVDNRKPLVKHPEQLYVFNADGQAREMHNIFND